MRWRRLDIPGTDACELVELESGWRLTGLAEFGSGERAARLAYVAECDRGWRTLRGSVHGAAGPRAIALDIRRTGEGEWRLGEDRVTGFDGLVDLDLGFTPATNLFPLRRLALRPGESADVEAAWLDDERWRFSRLPQRYERRNMDAYWYESPSNGYAALLTVTADGFVRRYPGLWEAIE
jgi:hypothetical protein